MSSPPRSNEESWEERKWCPLCGEWKEICGETDDSQTEVYAEVIYCPDCGAKLRESS